VLGVDLAVKSGCYQAELAGPMTYRQGKVDAIWERIGRLPDLAVGDTLTDLEMLLSAKDALLIGPRHTDLLPLAEEKGWAVQPIFEL
jgi:phosphoserine phosphatase